ncbi:helix-turn-helix transcriptional regulator [Bremerella cremea]
MIREAEARAASAGLPSAVEACQIREGGIGIGLARRILAACLGAANRIEVETDPLDSLTPEETAKLLGCSLRSLWRWEAQSRIPEGRRIGRTVRWDRKEIERLL